MYYRGRAEFFVFVLLGIVPASKSGEFANQNELFFRREIAQFNNDVHGVVFIKEKEGTLIDANLR